MGDRFASMRAIVNDNAEAVLGVTFLLRDLAHFQQEMAEQGLIVACRQANPRNRFLRDEKEMGRGLR